MAKNVTGQVLGGSPKVLEHACKVSDVYAALGLSGSYTASINGEAAEMSEELSDYSFVSFAPAVKGGI